MDPKIDRWLRMLAGDAANSAGEPRAAPMGTARNDEELLDAYSRAVVAVAEKVGPAVVSIGVRRRARAQAAGGEAAGSGVIIAPDGFVLTNNHVVEQAHEVEVRVTEGASYPAEIVGTDPATDLAVVRAGASSLPAAQLGDSEALRVGQLVIRATWGWPARCDR